MKSKKLDYSSLITLYPKQNIELRIKRNLRRRLKASLKGSEKKISAVKDLGCTWEEFKLHLEQGFYPHPITKEKMTWDNYGFYGWHIDHIKPISKFDLDSKRQLLKAFNYKNLQPMWAIENLKKSNKII